MADPNTRQGKRTPVTLKIKFKSETLEQFIERYAVDVSQGGIFIRTKDPLAVGTQMKFEFQLRDASPLIAGEGTVVWTRENDPSRPAIAPGMGVRFDRLAEGSQGVLERILAEKAKQAPQRGGGSVETTKPPMFTDTPTRVAPAPIQDALAGSGRTRAESEQTPLPKPMPFHSDADEFGAEAFEEATKVRQLDELVAATAAQSAEVPGPADELALRRPREAATVVPGTDDRDSAPALPSAPESGNTGRTGKLLDTSPSPRPQSPSSPPQRASQQLPALPALDGNRTRLGVEPAKAPIRSTERTTPLSVSTEAVDSAPPRPSAAPVVIGILVVVAAAIAAVWYFVLRTPVAQEVANKTGSDITQPITGSAGSGVAIVTGSNGSAGSAEMPKLPMVDTEISANVAKATVTVVDTGDSGPVPFKAKLEKDKHYKVRVEAPGFTAQELDVRGGQDKATAKLVAKLHVLTVKSEPSGAQIYIEGSGTGRVTPYDIELTAAQAARPKLHVMWRKSGYRSADQIVDSSAFNDDDKRVVAEVNAHLSPAPVVTNNNGNGGTTTSTHNGSGSTGAGSGSAVTPDTGSGAGSATPASGTGSAAVTSPPTTGATGSGEPEPDFVKKQP